MEITTNFAQQVYLVCTPCVCLIFYEDLYNVASRVTQRTERTYILILFRRFLFRIVARWTNEMSSKKLIGSVRDWIRRIRRNDRIVEPHRAMIPGKNIETKSREAETVSFINHPIATVFSTGIVSRSSRQLANFHRFHPPSFLSLTSSTCPLLSNH